VYTLKFPPFFSGDNMDELKEAIGLFMVLLSAGGFYLAAASLVLWLRKP
jgi:hypothetical protein